MPSLGLGTTITGMESGGGENRSFLGMMNMRDQFDAANEYVDRGRRWFIEQPVWKKLAILFWGTLIMISGVIMILFHNQILQAAIKLSQNWRNMRGGSLLMFFLVFCISFPPLLGYSWLSSICGMIWGFPHGWPILAFSTVVGSTCSFLLFRYVLREKAKRLLDTSKHFEAFTLALNDKNALWLLALIRLCPLPYSLSNGAFAAIPGIKLHTFILASVITSPKLLVPVFIGSKLADIGNSKSNTEVIIDIVGIAITVGAVYTATVMIYNKMQRILAELDNGGLTVSLDDEGNFEIDDADFLRDDDYEDDNLIV